MRAPLGVSLVVTAFAGLVLAGCGPAAGPGSSGASAPPRSGAPGGGPPSSLDVTSPCQVLSLADVAAAVGGSAGYDKDMQSGGAIATTETYCIFVRAGGVLPIIYTEWKVGNAATVDARYEKYRSEDAPSGTDISGLGTKAVCGTGKNNVNLIVRLDDRAWRLEYDFRGDTVAHRSPPSEQSACDHLVALARQGIDRLQGNSPLLSPTPGTSS
jgi:hypothetical protein